MGAAIVPGEELKIVMELLDGDVDRLLIKSREGGQIIFPRYLIQLISGIFRSSYQPV